MSSEDPLSREAVAAVDREGVVGEVLDLGEHLRDALWRVQSANITPKPTPGGIHVVGVDGLEQGGDLARQALVPALRAPLIVHHTTPPPADLPVTVLLASYSGEDAAVINALELTAQSQRVVLTTGGPLAAAARAAKVPIVPLPGGFPQPQLAIAYPLVVCLELARLAGLAANSNDAIEAAAAHVARLARQWGPDSPEDSPAKRTAAAFVAGEPSDYVMSVVESGEGELQRLATNLLFGNLVELYKQVLSAPGA